MSEILKESASCFVIADVSILVSLIPFSIFLEMQDCIVPNFLMNWANDYLSRQIVELEHETVRQQWNKASLMRPLYEKSVSEIHERQQDKEKHT